MERLNSITFAIFPAVFKRYYYYTSKCVCGVGYHIAQYALFHRKLWPNYMVLLCILCYKPNGRIFYDILLCIFNVRMLAMYIVQCTSTSTYMLCQPRYDVKKVNSSLKDSKWIYSLNWPRLLQLKIFLDITILWLIIPYVLLWFNWWEKKTT